MWFKFILMLSCLYDKKFVIPQNAIRFVFIFVWSWGLPLSYNFKFLPICNFISNFNIFHLMSQIESYCQYQNGTDSYWKLSLTVSGADSHTENYQSLFQELTHILKIISHCFVKYKMTLSIKTIMSVLKILTYIITSITSFPIWLAENLAIISVWTFVAVVILYRQLHSWIWVETLYGLFFLISFDNVMIFLSILYLT
jgi:hypothetical protein